MAIDPSPKQEVISQAESDERSRLAAAAAIAIDRLRAPMASLDAARGWALGAKQGTSLGTVADTKDSLARCQMLMQKAYAELGAALFGERS